MDVGQRIISLLSESLVELVILLLLDLVLVPQPDGLVVVDVDPIPGGLLDGLGLLLLLLFLLGDLDVIVLLLDGLLVFLLLNGHLLGDLLSGLKVDGEVDELGVLANEGLYLLLLRELIGVLLKVDGDLGASLQSVAAGVLDHVKGMGGAGFPDVLFVVVVLGHDGHLAACQEGRIETDTELADEVEVPALDGLDEVGGAGFGDGSQVMDQVLLRHADARVRDGDGLGVGVVFNADAELSLLAEHFRVADGKETDLV